MTKLTSLKIRNSIFCDYLFFFSVRVMSLMCMKNLDVPMHNARSVQFDIPSWVSSVVGADVSVCIHRRVAMHSNIYASNWINGVVTKRPVDNDRQPVIRISMYVHSYRCICVCVWEGEEGRYRFISGELRMTNDRRDGELNIPSATPSFVSSLDAEASRTTSENNSIPKTQGRKSKTNKRRFSSVKIFSIGSVSILRDTPAEEQEESLWMF